MDVADRNEVDRIRKKLSKDLPHIADYRPNYLEDGNFLIKMLEDCEKRCVDLETKLMQADILAMSVDVSIAEGTLDENSLISNARTSYGNPWNYEFTSKERLEKYKVA